MTRASQILALAEAMSPRQARRLAHRHALMMTHHSVTPLLHVYSRGERQGLPQNVVRSAARRVSRRMYNKTYKTAYAELYKHYSGKSPRRGWQKHASRRSRAGHREFFRSTYGRPQ